MTVADLMVHHVFGPSRGGVADVDGILPARRLVLQAVRRAEVLRRAGVVRGTHVAVAVKGRHWRSVAIDYLACAWIGAVAVLARSNDLLGTVDAMVRPLEDWIERGATRGTMPGRDRP